MGSSEQDYVKKKFILYCYDGPYTPWKSEPQHLESGYKTKGDAQNQSCDVVVLRALPNEGFFEEVHRQNLTV